MTQSGEHDHTQDDQIMPEDDISSINSKLSPSAQAVIRTIRLFEEGGHIDVFQEGADFMNLRRIVDAYKGSLYQDLNKRLDEVIELGGIKIITQRDVMSLINSLWDTNISRLSRIELPFLEAALQYPGESLKELTKRAGQSYSQARRALARLSATGVLKIGGFLNNIGLERVLIKLENPEFVLTGPYAQKHLFVDGYSPIVFTVGMVPRSRRMDFLDTIRSLRNTTTNASIYSLSTGKPNFSGIYCNTKKGWSVDLLHFRLMLRKGGDPITLADIPDQSTSDGGHFTYSEIKVMDALIDSLDGTAHNIVQSTNLSLSTAFRKRAGLLERKIILPRARVNIPQLSDRVIVMCSPEVGGNILEAWQNLPLTYISQVQNVEERSDKKMLLISALPKGSAQDLLDVLSEESSKADDLSAWKIAAGIGGVTRVSSMYDRRRNTWLFDTSQHFDARQYSVARKEASPNGIPLDLA